MLRLLTPACGRLSLLALVVHTKYVSYLVPQTHARCQVHTAVVPGIWYPGYSMYVQPPRRYCCIYARYPHNIHIPWYIFIRADGYDGTDAIALV